MPITWLGFDLSTQQIKAVLLSEDSLVVHESSVRFDKDLPEYGTSSGAIRGPDDGEVTSPVAMWLDAIDLLMERMKQGGVDFSSIAAVSGAGQQHGSVYWSKASDDILYDLHPALSLCQQLSPRAFSLPNAPIWQDSSTTKDCRDLEDAVGGPQVLADLTGSRAYERFTGPQIARIRRLKPEAYKATKHISLVSSFMPSLFLGRIAPIEVSDASGMNLMDVLSCKWNDQLLEACGGPELRSKLGPEPVPGGTVLGEIHPWWVQRWGFSPNCLIAPFTGDNSATVVSFSAPGDALLSLGTSTTLLLSIPPSTTPPKRFTTSHLLSHPTTPGAQIAMLCYKNGALAREQVRDKYAGGDWDRFNQLLDDAPPGNNGYMGLYFPLPEIIPPNVVGEFFFKYDPKNPNPAGTVTPVEGIPDTAHPRAILESQFLSIKSRIADILPSNANTNAPPLQRLVMTGGSSTNQTIRQLASDIFGMKVYVSTTKEGAGMGGAILAKYAWWRWVNGGVGTFEEMSGGEVEAVGMRCVAVPKEGVKEVYEEFVGAYRVCEDEAVKMKVGVNLLEF